MGRPGKPWRRTEDGWYYAKINGKQEKLSPVYEEALELFHALKQQASRQQARQRRERERNQGPGARARKLLITVEQVIKLYLEAGKVTKEEVTLTSQSLYLWSFCNHVSGDGNSSCRVHSLLGDDLDGWCRAMSPRWGPSTQAAARAAVLSALTWAVRAGHILENPFAGAPRGVMERRDRILSPQEREALRDALSPAQRRLGGMGDFLFFLEQTGCRPFSEAAKITPQHVNWQTGRIVLQKHKTRKKTRKPRTIYLTPAIAERLQKIADVRTAPEQVFFLNSRGNAFTRNSVCGALHRLAKRAKVPNLIAYAWRHTYITDALAKGLSASVVGELVGSSAVTLARFYDHLDQKHDVLRRAAQEVVGP